MISWIWRLIRIEYIWSYSQLTDALALLMGTTAFFFPLAFNSASEDLWGPSDPSSSSSSSSWWSFFWSVMDDIICLHTRAWRALEINTFHYSKTLSAVPLFLTSRARLRGQTCETRGVSLKVVHHTWHRFEICCQPSLNCPSSRSPQTKRCTERPAWYRFPELAWSGRCPLGQNSSLPTETETKSFTRLWRDIQEYQVYDLQIQSRVQRSGCHRDISCRLWSVSQLFEAVQINCSPSLLEDTSVSSILCIYRENAQITTKTFTVTPDTSTYGSKTTKGLSLKTL